MGAKAGISGDGAYASSFQEVLKVKEHTKHSTTVHNAPVSPHTKDVQTQGRAAQKNAISHCLGEGHTGTEQGTSVVSAEGQVQRHCSQNQALW